MQQDTDACAQLKSDATANSCQMPAGFAAEWAKTFAMHEASMKAVADKLQAVLIGTSTDCNPCSFVAENNRIVVSYKADAKTFRRLVAEYTKRATTAESTKKAKTIE